MSVGELTTGFKSATDSPITRPVRRLLAAAVLTLAVAPAARADEIVVLEQSTDDPVSTETAERERDLGFDAERRFTHAMRAFTADLTGAQIAELERDPEVAEVLPNHRVTIRRAVAASNVGGVPPGVRRIIGSSATTVREAATGAVAVLDTGVDLQHPDLNVEEGRNCASTDPPGTTADDVHGHGTHVAGTIGALNNASGVTGVAPGTKIYAVKVLGDDGSGSLGDLICGIDWVLTNARSKHIGVVNLSLGGGGFRGSTCDNDAEHRMYCRLADAGVTPVVAAGNEGADVTAVPASGAYVCAEEGVTVCPDAPGSFPEVLSVTAMADTNGAAGGGGPSCGGTADDATPTFSNWSAVPSALGHMVAAPGVCVRSTAIGGGTRSMSGTSMAAPHVAALVALCKGEGGATGQCATMTTPQVIARVRAAGPGSAFTPIAGRSYGPLALLADLTTPTAEAAAAPAATAAPAPAAQMPADPPPPAPAPAAAPVPSTPTATRPTVARPTLGVHATRLGRLRTTGLAIRIRCATRCTGIVRLRVSRATARRLRLRSTILATARVTRAGAVTLKPAKAARRALARQRTLAATLSAELRSGGRTVRLVKPLRAAR